MEDPITNNNIKELSAILDADSFFYGIFQAGNLLRIGSKDIDILENFEEELFVTKVAIRSEIFTHVPVDSFVRKNKKEYLSFHNSYKLLKKPYVSYDVLPCGIVTVWAIEGATKKAISKFSDDLLHLSSALIDYILSFKRDGVFIHFLNESFEILVIEEDALLFYSKYDYYMLTDLLYFVRLAFKNHKLDPKQDDLYLLGEVAYQDERYNVLLEYFNKVEFLDFVNDVKRRNSHKNAALVACHQCES